jgi:hypothetical protein
MDITVGSLFAGVADDDPDAPVCLLAGLGAVALDWL